MRENRVKINSKCHKVWKNISVLSLPGVEIAAHSILIPIDALTSRLILTLRQNCF